MKNAGIVNILLRIMTLVSKFILTLLIARYLTPEELGIYGLFVTSTTMSLYILGMDFYIFNMRQILSKGLSHCTPLIRDQIIFHLSLYVIFLPLLAFVFIFEILPWKYVGWFYLLVVLEHLSQESSRLFVTFSKSPISNFILFIRSGVWIYFIVFYVWINRVLDLDLIWVMWSIGAFLSLTVTFKYLSKLDWTKAWQERIDWQWIKNGVLSSNRFFIATTMLVVIDTSFRYLLKHYYDNSIVGVYTFYINMANVINTFISSGVIVIVQPKIIEAYQKHNELEYNFFMKKLAVNSILGSFLVGLVLAIGIYPILILVNKNLYIDYLNVFWILIFSVIANVISQIPHMELYAKNQDKYIMYSTILSVSISLILSLYFIQQYSVIGAAIGNLLLYFLLFVSKTICLRKIDSKIFKRYFGK